VDADGVQAASGKAAGPADTGVVSVGSANAAGRRTLLRPADLADRIVWASARAAR
jgi:hypothetical protein